jgi:hypothetical protein
MFGRHDEGIENKCKSVFGTHCGVPLEAMQRGLLQNPGAWRKFPIAVGSTRLRRVVSGVAPETGGRKVQYCLQFIRPRVRSRAPKQFGGTPN